MIPIRKVGMTVDQEYVLREDGDNRIWSKTYYWNNSHQWQCQLDNAGQWSSQLSWCESTAPKDCKYLHFSFTMHKTDHRGIKSCVENSSSCHRGQDYALNTCKEKRTETWCTWTKRFDRVWRKVIIVLSGKLSTLDERTSKKTLLKRVYDWMGGNKCFNIMSQEREYHVGDVHCSQDRWRAWKESNAAASKDANVRNQNEEEGMALRTERSVGCLIINTDLSIWNTLTNDSSFLFPHDDLSGRHVKYQYSNSATIRSYACVPFQTRLTWIHHVGFSDDPHSKMIIRKILVWRRMWMRVRDQIFSKKQVRGDVSRRWKVCLDWWKELSRFSIVKEVWIILTTGVRRTSLKISKCTESEERILKLTNWIIMKRIEESNERVLMTPVNTEEERINRHDYRSWQLSAFLM